MTSSKAMANKRLQVSTPRYRANYDQVFGKAPVMCQASDDCPGLDCDDCANQEPELLPYGSVNTTEFRCPRCRCHTDAEFRFDGHVGLLMAYCFGCSKAVAVQAYFEEPPRADWRRVLPREWDFT